MATLPSNSGPGTRTVSLNARRRDLQTRAQAESANPATEAHGAAEEAPAGANGGGDAVPESGPPRVRMTAELLERKVAGLSSLPSLSDVIKKVSHMAEDKQANAADFAAVISLDAALCSKILRLVNSPVYGFPGRISSIKHAVVLLGFNVIKGLVLGTALFGGMGDERSKRLWEHCLGCAIVSRRIAVAAGLPDVEEVMIAGLLHDFGKVAIAYSAPEDNLHALRTAEARDCHIGEAEREVFGVDHAAVAGWLAKHWCFPAKLSEPVQYHHRPELARSAKEMTATVHLADILARALGYGFPGDSSMPPLNHETFQGLRLCFSQIDKIACEADDEYSAGAAVFNVED